MHGHWPVDMHDFSVCAMTLLMLMISIASVFSVYQIIKNFRVSSKLYSCYIHWIKVFVLLYLAAIYALAYISTYIATLTFIQVEVVPYYARPGVFLLVLIVGIDAWTTALIRGKKLDGHNR